MTVRKLTGNAGQDERSTTVAAGGRHVWREYIDRGGEFTLRIAVVGYDARTVTLRQPYDSSSGDHLLVTITEDTVRTQVTSD